MRCPYCRQNDFWKMKTPHWMRLTPGPMRNMRCSNCGAEFTKWLLFLPIRHSTTRKLISAWHLTILFMLLLVIGFGSIKLMQMISLPS